MKFPGENNITLSIPALLQIIEDRLKFEMGRDVRVTDGRESNYGRTFSVTITTDPAPDATTAPTTEETQ